MLFELHCENPVCPFGEESGRIRFWLRTKALPAYTHIELRVSDEGGVLWSRTLSAPERTAYGGPCLREDSRLLAEALLFEGEKLLARSEKSLLTGFFPERAQWVGFPGRTGRVLEFRRQIRPSGKVLRASLSICGLGFFRASLGGEALGETFFDPVVTDYGKRDLTRNPDIRIGGRQTVCATVYDVTARLKPGGTLLSVLVGNGYFQNEDKPEEPCFSYGEKRLIFECRIRYADGREERVCSDAETEVRETAFCSDLYKGDRFDFAARETPFLPARPLPAPGGSWRIAPIRADIPARTLQPRLIQTCEGGRLYDFGLNHTGGLSLRARGRRGSRLTVRFAEVLYEDGTPNFETGEWKELDGEGRVIHAVAQRSEYILSGDEDFIRPLFCWHCYRYVQLECEPDTRIEGLCSLFLHADVRESGSFSCEEPLFEHIERSSVLTLLDNMHSGLLTDCPHREKRPYTGDGRVVAESLLYALDGTAFLDKWLDDILAAQDESGFVPYTAPHLGGGGGLAWGTAIAELPLRLYEYTGDESFLRRAYGGLCRWVDYCGRHAEEGIIRSNGEKWCLGDWMTPGLTAFSVPFMSTLSYYQSAAAAARMAGILGLEGEAARFSALSGEIAGAINRRFFDETEMRYGKGVQGENLWPLALGIVPEPHREALRRAVRRTYEENGCRLDTGFLTTPVLFETLFTQGMEDLAYGLLTRTEYPSYGFMLQGETTLCENWAKKWPDYCFCEDGGLVKGGGELSHCHPMYGSVVAVLYKYAAGLNLSALYRRRLLFTPMLLARMRGAAASNMTPFGFASIRWERGERLRMQVEIPRGLRGEVRFPFPAASLRLEEEGREIPSKDGLFCFELDSGRWTLTEGG